MLNQVRATLRSRGVPFMRNRIIAFCNRISNKLTQSLKRIPVMVLGEMMADRLAGLEDLHSYDVLINNKIVTIKPKERKAQERGW